ncbi:MAG: hypothetical protein PHO10_03675 [Gemmiger sp.]|nr:hypothetical protein [Gemmiger sp.]
MGNPPRLPYGGKGKAKFNTKQPVILRDNVAKKFFEKLFAMPGMAGCFLFFAGAVFVVLCLASVRLCLFCRGGKLRSTPQQPSQGFPRYTVFTTFIKERQIKYGNT